MKKIILGLIILSSISSMAFSLEANVKVGYDFYRSSTRAKTDLTNSTTTNNGRGFIVGAEVYPLQFLDEAIKIGAGVEYNFGETKLGYDYDENNVQQTVEKQNVTATNGKYIATFIPVYGALKLETYKSEETNLRLYTVLRMGYVFMNSFDESKKPIPSDSKRRDGFYYGLGLGLTKDWFLSELVYDGRYTRNANQCSDKKEDFHHKIGLRLGLRVGYETKPKIMENTTTVIDSTIVPVTLKDKTETKEEQTEQK
ncbi:hypothetical protein [Caviibacter abscessus]|uniref:hypothetical protein n=1 Tax=Caviibacter abscessus TaxID=1766719 RepID=UPI00083970E0|nr:hypothetical protein [Caviibacter abscessus]